jgi:deoxyribonuclease V
MNTPRVTAATLDPALRRLRVDPREAVQLQRRLRDRVRLQPAPMPDRVLGVDCAFLDDRILAAAVVWDLAAGRVVEQRCGSAPLRFPYVPGLLSFRELPVLLPLIRRVRTPFGGILCDGQGIAHPRRLGIASHLGLLLACPTVGCAKSRLAGSHEAVGDHRGDQVPLLLDGDQVGCVLRTRDGVKPLYVSPGHLVDVPSAAAWVLACGAGYRLPEPTRLADRLVAAFKKRRQVQRRKIAAR